MKKIIAATSLFVLFLVSCHPAGDKNRQLQNRIDSLEQQLAGAYRPGFGEFMNGIQLHHAKLWAAGSGQNWALAEFEIGEIGETLEDIRKYNAERPEIKSIGMLTPVLDSLQKAVQQKDSSDFRKKFIVLTQTCNNCHRITAHEFNVITLPTGLPVVNQDFKASTK